MINWLWSFVLQGLISLRYRVRVTGVNAVRQQNDRGILFLPNHPALIEPVITMVFLYRIFQPRVLADSEQLERPFINFLTRRINALRLPSLSRAGNRAPYAVHTAIEHCVQALDAGDNLVLYPAGRIYRSECESIGANSAVERILKERPEVRIVLVRTTGLWGSRFSWAAGQRPLVIPVLWQGLKDLLGNGLFFMPRRLVTIELIETCDLPRTANRRTLNTYLEKIYNQTAMPAAWVPYAWWQSAKPPDLTGPAKHQMSPESAAISPSVRKQVLERLHDMTGMAQLQDEMSLTRDLGLDSLASVDLVTWLAAEYGHTDLEVDALQTVGDVLRAACGEAVSIGEAQRLKAPARWFRRPPLPGRPRDVTHQAITDVFLYQARRNRNRPVVADLLSGVKTYRDMVTAILLLRREWARLPGTYLGIMLPASVGATIVYLATLFAGKIPVMVNWTLGRRNLKHTLDSLNVQHIVTARTLLTRLGSQGIDLGDILERFICLEDLRGCFSWQDKLSAWMRSWGRWQELTTAPVPDTAAVLFTSGSENVPKAVPLTHSNILTNISDATDCLTISDQDSLLGILPPFHSFGLTVSMLLPVTMGVRVFFYPNPTHGGMLGQLIDTYQLSFLVGTPTFLQGIVSITLPKHLQTLRLVVSGAEKCPQRVYDLLSERCPYTKVLEGYGVTECSPVVSVNRPWQVRAGTVGKALASVEVAIVDTDSGKCAGLGQSGLLLVRGESIFDGYLNYEGPSPFVEFEGKSWYRTGDLVSQDYEGILTFRGRLQRFIKLGGEMISLPAIETVLQEVFFDSSAEGPTLAVVATPVEENPEVVLFSTQDITREMANQALRAAGLSGLHFIRQVHRIDTLPLLGTGKVDYRSLVANLA
ncbi:AMP-binding protein [Planctomycetota bacterium]